MAGTGSGFAPLPGGRLLLLLAGRARCGVLARFAVALAVLLRAGRGRELYLGVVLELVKTAAGEDLARIYALHLGKTDIGDTGRDVADMRDVILNDVHIGFGTVLLDRRGRYKGDVLQGIEQQARIHELVGKQRAILVVELRPGFYRSRRGIDLVVKRQQFALGELLLPGAVKSVGRQLRPAAQPRLYLTQVVFGDREDDRDRRLLGEDRQRRRAGGSNEIAGIDQAQSDASRERRGDVAEIDLDLIVLHGTAVAPDDALV